MYEGPGKGAHGCRMIAGGYLDTFGVVMVVIPALLRETLPTYMPKWTPTTMRPSILVVIPPFADLIIVLSGSCWGAGIKSHAFSISSS